MLSLPPAPADSRWLPDSKPPPPTSSMAPRSSKMDWLPKIVDEPPSMVERVAEPPATTCRAVGTSAPTALPPGPALLIHAPATETSAPRRTETNSLGVCSLMMGAALPAGSMVSVPPGRRMSPATSICTARRFSSVPAAARRLTSAGRKMRPLEFSSTVPKLLSRSPWAVNRGAPNTWLAPRLKRSCCAVVSALAAPKLIPKVSLAPLVQKMLPMRWPTLKAVRSASK